MFWHFRITWKWLQQQFIDIADKETNLVMDVKLQLIEKESQQLILQI